MSFILAFVCGAIFGFIIGFIIGLNDEHSVNSEKQVMERHNAYNRGVSYGYHKAHVEPGTYWVKEQKEWGIK